MPRVAVPLINVTVPVGTTLPAGPVTVAVKVTFAPATALVTEAVNAVVVARGFTVTATAPDTEALSKASPPYDAVIEWEPTLRDNVE